MIWAIRTCDLITMFQFSLTTSETLELFRLLHSQPDGPASPVENLRQTLYSQLPPTFRANGSSEIFKETSGRERRVSGTLHGRRFSPYDAHRPSPPPPPRNACVRGGRKGNMRGWVEDDHPFLEKNPRARAFLRQFTILPELHGNEKTGAALIALLKTVLISGAAEKGVSDRASLTSAVRKCSAENTNTIAQTFHQVLAQIELAMVINRYEV